jgi:hypothetical protein
MFSEQYSRSPDVSFMYNPEAPFGLESFDPELTAEGLTAERMLRGHVLKRDHH